MSPSIRTMGFFMSEINFCNTKEQLNHLGEVVTGKVDGSPSGADIDTSTLSYTGQVRKTLPALEGEYEQSITNKEAEADAAIDAYRLLNKGPYTSGITLNSKFEYITYNGDSYFATNPPYTTTATTPDADGNLFVGGYVNELQAGEIAEAAVEVGVPKYTDIVYKSSVGNSAFDNMLSESPLASAIGDILSTGSTPWVKVSDVNPVTSSNFRALGAVSPFDIGSESDPTSIQKAIDTGYDVYVPEGVWLYDNINLQAGQVLSGAGRGKSILKATSTTSIVDIGGFKHNVTIRDVGFDGDNVAEKCVSLKDTFRTCISRVNMYNYPVAGLELLKNTYFSSFTDIHIDYIGTGISIQPDIDYNLEHAASNANLFQNIAINHFTVRGIDMKNAAGNTFNVINYEQAENSAIECLRIDHCTNNTFITNWFEPGNPTSMTRLVYFNDNFNRYYTRNNEFINGYFVGGTSGNVLYHILTGSCLRNTVRNSTFLRAKSCLQNGGDSKYFKLAKSNTYNLFDGSSKVVSGTIDRQVVHSKTGTATLNAANNTVTINFDSKGTDLQYDGATLIFNVSSFSGISDQSNLSLYSYKYSDRIEVFHQGAAITGGTEIDFDYILNYYVEA